MGNNQQQPSVGAAYAAYGQQYPQQAYAYANGYGHANGYPAYPSSKVSFSLIC